MPPLSLALLLTACGGAQDDGGGVAAAWQTEMSGNTTNTTGNTTGNTTNTTGNDSDNTQRSNSLEHVSLSSANLQELMTRSWQLTQALGGLLAPTWDGSNRGADSLGLAGRSNGTGGSGTILAQETLLCASGGAVEQNWVDQSLDGRFSAADALVSRPASCQLSTPWGLALREDPDSQLVVALESVNGSLVTHYQSLLSNQRQALGGHERIFWGTVDGRRELHEAYFVHEMAGDELIITGADGTLLYVRDISLRLSADYDWSDWMLSVNATWQRPDMGQYWVPFTTTMPVRGNRLTTPRSGELSLEGRRISPQREQARGVLRWTAPGQVLLRLDADGDHDFETESALSLDSLNTSSW
ncbi:MAG: hypothetical protein H7831_11865 [Magnetococcus sp. WYHC-3]